MRFEKPALAIADQIALLKRRGMIVDDDARAQHCLGYLSYYRLRAYWLPFEVPAARAGDHAFRKGTRFEDVVSLYVFDRELRLLVFDAIERVEIALRARWAQHMALAHGPHGYLDQALYSRMTHHARAVDSLTREFERSRDAFAGHYRERYTSPNLPPVWMAAEVMSFGLLSKFYGGLKHRNDRQAIAKTFGLDERVLASFAHHMNHVRNICAHHGRLWNKRVTVTMTIPESPATLSGAMNGAEPRYLHNSLVMLDYLLSAVAPGTRWRTRLLDLLAGCPFAEPSAMGFPEDWRARPAWSRA